MNPRDDLPGDDVPQDATISRLYRELPDAAPSPDTDARILAAARRAVGAGPRRGGFVAAHWRGVGSAAAALLLGVALTVQWRTQPSGRLEEALATAPAPEAAAPRDDTAVDALFADESGAAADGAAAPAAPPAAAGAPVATEEARAARAKAEAVADAGAAARATARSRTETVDAAAAGAMAGGGDSAGPASGAGAGTSKEAADALASAQAALAAPAAPAAPVATAAAPKPAPAAVPMTAAPSPSVAAEAVAPARRQAERKAIAQAQEAAPAERQEARVATAPAAAPMPAPARSGAGLTANAVAPAAPPAALAGNVAARADAARDIAAAPVAKAAAPAGASVPALPLHARLMAEGRHAEALAALVAPATPEAIVDRDLLRQALQPGSMPACASPPGPGAQALLCDGLRLRAAGGQPTAAWRAALERSGLVSGAFAYRRGLVDKVFGPASP